MQRIGQRTSKDLSVVATLWLSSRSNRLAYLMG